MSDRAALYAAVCADPDDDTAKLVLADWLEEHGETKRATFIRTKVDLERRESADSEAAAMHKFGEYEFDQGHDRVNWARLDPELAELCAAEKAARKAEMRLIPKREGAPRINDVSYEGDSRGFLHSVDVTDTAAFLRHADSLFRTTPITSVSFNYMEASDATTLVNRGLLARIRELTFWDMEDAEVLEILGRHPDAAGVRMLDLEVSDVSGAELVDALMAGKHWAGLRRLDLMDITDNEDEPSDEQLTRLFSKPPFPKLQTLIAWGNNFNNATLRAIAAGGLPELRHLDLAMNDITDTGLEALAKTRGLPNLRFLDLSMNEAPTGKGTAALINTTNLPKLTVLKFGGMSMGAPDPKALAKPGRGPGLRVLDLSGGILTRESVEALTSCPALRGLWHLGLSATGLNSKAVEPLFKSAGFDQLALLDLGHNALTYRAAAALAKWPAPASLQWLRVAGNKLTSEGLALIAEGTHLAGLRQLGVSTKKSTRGYRLLKKRFGKGLNVD